MTTDANEFEIAAIQMVSSSQAQENMARAATLIAQAASAGAQLVLLPEYFCIMGQHDHDKLHLKETEGTGPLQDFLASQAKQHQVWLIGGTIPLKSPDADRIYNACLVYDPQGNQQARYDKIHLFGFDNGREVFQESDTIMAGSAQPVVVPTPAGPVGLSVCYDLRFPELYRVMGEVSLIVVPSAFTYTTGKAHWEVLLRARAIENQCYVLAAAQGGKHTSGRRTWGHSILIDPWGTVMDCLPEGEGIVRGTLSQDRLARVRRALPALTHKTMV